MVTQKHDLLWSQVNCIEKSGKTDGNFYGQKAQAIIFLRKMEELIQFLFRAERSW